jgi:exopolyphosphatase/guanosine-5'-triphosphate,3'-diphosphate pyrophosphatase
MRARGFVRSFSQPVGALRFTERYVRTDPINNKDFRALEAAISERFTDLDWLSNAGNTTLTGIGGTIRSLAELDQKLRSYPMDRVHAHILRLQRLEELIELLRGMNQRQREDLPGISRDRADLILTGALILRALMLKGRFDSLMVSGQGLREGLFYEQFLVGEQPPIFPDLRNFSIQNLARNYTYEAIHSAKVRELALALFDQLRALHAYSEWERELLGYASTVHDIGLAVNYYDHHKHSAYLVLNASLSGFSHREIAILALLTRYHRKGDVNVDEFGAVLEPGDDLRVARLAALLRLAEFMERRKHQIVQGVQVEIGDQIRITLRTTGDAAVEIWNANRGAGLFRKAFGKDVVIV